MTSSNVDRTVVSTDNPKLAATARKAGAEAPFLRPRELSADRSPMMSVVLHALKWLETNGSYRPDAVILLQPTSPLRTAADIDAAWRLFRSRRADAVVSVTPALQHPEKIMAMNRDGRLSRFMPSRNKIERRQDLRPAYAQNGAIYLASRRTLVTRRTWFTRRTFAYLMPPERSIDIDEPWQLEVAAALMRRLPR